jgi:hypothetical protein
MIVSNQPIPLHQFEIWHQLFCATTCRFTQDTWECGNHVVVDYEIFDMHEFNDFHDEYLKLIKPNKQDIEMNIFDEMDEIKTKFENVISKLHNHTEEDTAINIIIDDSDPTNQIFVEIENDRGESIGIGEELTTGDGYRKIRISTSNMINHGTT